MKMLGKGRHNFPVSIWEIIMTEYAVVYMPALPMV
jgi:ribosomal protein L39E